MIAILVVLGVIAYLVSVRIAYYWLVTRKPYVVRESTCSHGYACLHRGESCHKVDVRETQLAYTWLSFLGPLLLVVLCVPAAFRRLGRGIVRALTWKQPELELGAENDNA